MKDNFTKQAAGYAKFRPGYPAAMVETLANLALRHERAWDCATGNGQIASMLSPFFKEVNATDLSAKQLEHAIRKPNIHYAQGLAESTDFPDSFFDLITVGQAVHWFDFDRFNDEVRRVGAPGCVLALIGYSLFKTGTEIDVVVRHFYENIVGPYWDKERRHIDNGYRSIPFPFREIEMPTFRMEYHWALETLTGYLRTWSAVQHFQAGKGYDPVGLIEDELKEKWQGGGELPVQIDILLKVGRLPA